MIGYGKNWTAGAFVLAGLLAASVAVHAQADKKCADLMQLKVDNTVLTDAALVPAGTPFRMGFGPRAMSITSIPEHCLVHGEVNHHMGADGKSYGDRFELRMPTAWEGRLLFTGGGGLDGVIRPALGMMGFSQTGAKSALSLGYAVVATDGGHQDSTPGQSDASFGSDPSSRDDYNFLSTKRVTDAARALMTGFYGKTAKYSYFQGCSNGGREALMTAERYPEYFDGVVAGAPAFNLTHAAIDQAWNTTQLATIAPKRADGTPDLSESLTEGDLKLLVKAILDKCDDLDGLKDGLIFNTQACHFDPSVVQCGAGKSAECLAPEKVAVVKKIFDAPVDSKGHVFYTGWPYDSGIAGSDWRNWRTGNNHQPSIDETIFPSFLNGDALANKGPRVDMLHFDFDADTKRVDKASPEINATATDWSAFKKRNGKLILYTGMSDPVFSPADLIRFYNEIEKQNGGDAAVHEFARLFLAPGVNHCAGGPGMDQFDLLGTIQEWVEHGKAPDAMTATGATFPGRTRPICAYPLIAKYDGKGDPESASSFACKMP